MPFYYSVAASHTTAAGAATQTLATDTRGAATGRTYTISRLVAGAKGAAQDNQTLWQAWRPAVIYTAGSAQIAEKHDVNAPTGQTTYQITPTVGTKGNFPVVQLPFNSRAMVQWVALNPDEGLLMPGVTTVNGNMSFYSEQAAGVAVAIVHTTTWYE